MPKNTPDFDYLLVSADIAHMTNVSRAAVANWIARGKIPKPSYIGRTPDSERQWLQGADWPTTTQHNTRSANHDSNL